MPHVRLAVAIGLAACLSLPAGGQDAWNPYKEREPAPRARRDAAPAEPERPALAPMGGVGSAPWRNDAAARTATGQRRPLPVTPAGTAAEPVVEREALPPLDEKSRAVERSELQPTLTSDGTAMPFELWQGVDAKVVEGLVAELDIPPRSPALHALWRRLWTADAPPASGEVTAHFEALRIEALYRSGLVAEVVKRLEAGDAVKAPLLAAQAARVAIGAGDRPKGCAAVRSSVRATDLPAIVKTEMLLLGGYCAAVDGNREAAGLAADLVRPDGSQHALALAALDAISAGQPFKPGLPNRLSLIDYRFLEAAGAVNPKDVVSRAEPALLAALATGEATEPLLKVMAGEAAAKANAIDFAQLAEIYRSNAPADAGDPLTAKGDPAMRRAALFKAVEQERTPMRKARLARALLDEARRMQLVQPVLEMLARPIEDMVAAQEIGWFAETAIEINLGAGRLPAARAWIDFAAHDRGAGLQHWLVLLDIADPKLQGERGAALVHAEQLAARGRFSADLLHRLATVLDALDYQIPIPLWEAASRTPQPAAGHLPATGVLKQLQDAAKRKEFGRTVLLAMRAIGPNSAEGVHMIALGDAIRGFKRAGLTEHARRLGLEALLARWPRMTGN